MVLPIGLGGAALVGAAVAVAVFGAGRGSPEPGASAADEAAGVAEAARILDTSSHSVRSDPEIANSGALGSKLPEVTPSGAGAAAVSGVNSAPAASAKAAPKAPLPAPKPRATAPAPAPKPAGCDPPYSIDANGHKRYKRECL